MDDYVRCLCSPVCDELSGMQAKRDREKQRADDNQEIYEKAREALAAEQAAHAETRKELAYITKLCRSEQEQLAETTANLSDSERDLAAAREALDRSKGETQAWFDKARRQTDALGEVRDALEPFGRYPVHQGDQGILIARIDSTGHYEISFDDLRRARAALSKRGEEG